MTSAEVVSARRRSAAAIAVVVLAYVVLCCVMLAPIFNFGHPASASYEGDARLIIWTLAWDNHVVVDGIRHWFDANIFYPAPNALAYSEHLFGISIFTLPVYWLTRNPVLAYNLVWLASYLLSALAAYVLAWHYTRDRLASFIAGVGFAFCFFRMHHGHGHLHMIWSFWIPISIVVMDRWIAGPTWRRATLFVAVLVLQALASWYQAVLIVIADALYLAWCASAERCFAREEGARRLAAFARQALVGAAIAVACLWPFARRYTVLSGASVAEAAASAADVTGFLVPPENTFAGQWLLSRGMKGPRWIWGEQTVYLGWTILALALVGALVAIRSRRDERRSMGYYIVLGLAAFALAVGPSASEIAANQWGWTPFALLMRVPGISLFRAPARFAELLTLALAVLAAAGASALHNRWGRRGRAVTVVAIALFLVESYVVKFPGGPPRPYPVPKLYRQLATMPAGAVVSLPDYAGSTDWYLEPNYQYFSMIDWYPIANGYSRAEPVSFRPLIERLKTFPGEDCVAAMRDANIRYVVLHVAAFPSGAAVVASAIASRDFRLVARAADDYAFEIAK